MEGLEKVVGMITDDIGAGLGIMPVVGSGMSAASGIPAGDDYRAYLWHCLTRVFEKPPWNPSQLRWPPFAEVPVTPDLEGKMWEWSQSKLGAAQPSREITEHQKALWQALGAVADWRATLHLLSRLDVNTSGDGGVRLKEPDPRIIDSFFVNLTKGRRPNRAHLLLAHLADVLRIKVILTTNFDELLESAFQRFDMPIATFDVHYEAGFPDARFVRAQRSIVKIHGGRYGLRADFSLDQLPNPTDVNNFISYLAVFDRRRVTSQSADEVVRRHQRNLLVMGVSGHERRTVALMCHALVVCEDLRVYWVSHRESDVEGVRDAFEQTMLDIYPARATELRRHMRRLVVVAAADLGLFLLTLYQRIFRCLPPGGVPFNAIWPIPAPPYAGLRSDANFKTAVSKLTDRIMTLGVNPNLFVHGEAAVPSVAAESFFQLRRRRRCIWMELEEEFDPTDFALLALEAFAHEAGMVDMLPMRLDRKELEQRVPEVLVRQLRRVTSFSTQPFVLFINGRDCPARLSENRPHASNVWREHEVARFSRIIEWLAQSRNVCTVVLGWKDSVIAPLRLQPPDVARGHAAEHLGNEALRAPDDLYRGHWHEVEKILPHSPEERATRVFQALEDDASRRFLFALTLFRYPPYRSAVNTRGVAGRWDTPERLADQGATDTVTPSAAWRDVDRDEIRARHVERWLEVLRRTNIVRDGDGHPIAMHRSVRSRLRTLLLKDASSPLRREESGIIQGIADWYCNLYLSSGDILAALESVRQRLDCVDAALRGSASDSPDYYVLSSLAQAVVAFRSIRPAMESSARPLTLGRVFGRIKRQLDELRASLSGFSDVVLSRDALRALERVELEWKGLAMYLRYDPTSGGSHPPAPVSAVETDLQSPGASSAVQGAAASLEAFELAQTAAARHQNERLLEIRDWANQRKYDKAEHHLDELLYQLVGWRLKDILAGSFKQQRGYRPERSRLHLAVRSLRSLHLLELYRAEAIRCLIGCIGAADATRARALQTQREAYLSAADRIYRVAADHLRYVEDLQFLHEQNAFLRANTGVALASQRRYTEANRKYNEAYSRLNFLSGPSLALRFATVDMRRTEAFLFKLEDVNPALELPAKYTPQRAGSPETTSLDTMSLDTMSPDTMSPDATSVETTSLEQRERCLGVLYDAIASVDRAAYKARGESVSTVWSSWLCELELRVCVQLLREARAAETARLSYSVHELFARCRDGVSVGEWFRSSLDSALFVVGTDIFRNARYIDLAHRFLALTAGTRIVEAQHKSGVELLLRNALELLSRAKLDDSELDAMVVEYAYSVRDAASRWLHRGDG